MGRAGRRPRAVKMDRQHSGRRDEERGGAEMDATHTPLPRRRSGA
ncbi:hypothetical protein A7982_13798 [Minicystis rosea]|nr:hypothetical protein A7982_13798 [Minicystis rosea]